MGKTECMSPIHRTVSTVTAEPKRLVKMNKLRRIADKNEVTPKSRTLTHRRKRVMELTQYFTVNPQGLCWLNIKPIMVNSP